MTAHLDMDNGTIQLNIASRTAAAECASLIKAEMLGLDAETFWRHFDAATRPDLHAKPDPPKKPARVVSCDSDVDEMLAEMEELQEHVNPAGQSYAENVLEITRSIAIGVEQRGGTATPGQVVAVQNMLDGLRKWCGGQY